MKNKHITCKTKSIIDILGKLKEDYNTITVPMYVYNIIVDLKEFNHLKISEIGINTEVGMINNFKVFLSLEIKDNLVLISSDLQTNRNNTLSTILDNKKQKKDLTIRISN